MSIRPSKSESTLQPATQRRVAEAFREFVAHQSFPCVGAKSALRRGNAEINSYERLGSGKAAEDLARDLRRFAHSRVRNEQEFSTFVACFSDPVPFDEVTFEELLWLQLQRLAALDLEPWDCRVGSDPEDNNFSFSFAGCAFFVVGLHPGASRKARRFAWPSLVFNLHDQFERLRREGKYERMQAVIRSRDVALQGTVNPMVSDFGRRSEARQYSGRHVDDDWSCPFRPADPGRER